MKNNWIELNLNVLKSNIAHLKAALDGKILVFVVKANAYGHGLLPTSIHAWNCGVRWFAVAHAEEGLALRARLPEANVLILGRLNGAEACEAAAQELIPLLVNEAHARELSDAVAPHKLTLRCHAKIDTGMGRLGFPWNTAGQLLPSCARLPGLVLEGICSHFASSASGNRQFADLQFERFRQVVSACESAGLPPLFRHISNSSGVLRDPAWHLDGIRPGILLYGYAVAPEEEDESAVIRRIDTRPFLQWKTRVVQVKRVPSGFPVSYDSTYRTSRDTVLATIDVGYADGYSRALSGKGHVLIRGQRCPIAGRVTMNLIAVDAGPGVETKEGDEVVLLGRQGTAEIWADELAVLGGTIPYEILTSIRTADLREA
jgi:alanine racemase